MKIKNRVLVPIFALWLVACTAIPSPTPIPPSPTPTLMSPTNTPIPPTPTATAVPPTNTSVPPTATSTTEPTKAPTLAPTALPTVVLPQPTLPLPTATKPPVASGTAKLTVVNSTKAFKALVVIFGQGIDKRFEVQPGQTVTVELGIPGKYGWQILGNQCQVFGQDQLAIDPQNTLYLDQASNECGASLRRDH